MAATNLYTWTPCIGGSGDDLFNVPGATKLDGSFDSSNPPTKMALGGTSYSTIPTIAEINAGSGLNQVIAAYNRRAGMYNSEFGTTLTIMSYLTTTGSRTLASSMTTLFSNIGSLKQQEGLSDTTWTISAPAARRTCWGHQLAYLRKKIGFITGTVTQGLLLTASPSFYGYFRVDSPSYGTGASESIAGVGIGKAGNGVGTNNMKRFRTLFAYPMPDWLATSGITSASITYKLFATSTTLESGWHPVVYSYNSDVRPPSLTPAFSGTFYNYNTLEATFAINTTNQTASLTTTPIVNRAGQYYCIMTATDMELAGTGLDPTNTVLAADATIDNITITLTI